MKLPIDWSQVPREFNYAAMDASGKIYAYSTKPEINFKTFFSDETSILIFSPDYWSDSLTERPKDDWIPWEGGDCPVDDNTTVVVKLRSGNEKIRIACFFVWKWDSVLPHDDIVAYRVVKENKVEQAKQEPANRAFKHPYADFIAESLKNTSRKIEGMHPIATDGKWLKFLLADVVNCHQDFKFRFADEAKQECVSPLSDMEIRKLAINNGSETFEDVSRRMVNAAHRAALKWVAELKITNLAQRENAAIVKFQAQLKRMAGE